MNVVPRSVSDKTGGRIGSVTERQRIEWEEVLFGFHYIDFAFSFSPQNVDVFPLQQELCIVTCA